MKHDFKCTTTNVIFKWPEAKERKVGIIHLLNDLSKEVGWADCIETGPESILKPGDKLLISKRITTMDLMIDNVTYNNTSDLSVIGYKRKDVLSCTGGTFLYEYITNPGETVTESGIIVIKKTSTKEFEPIWVKVVACGPTSGVQPGDEILIAYKSDCYSIPYFDGKELHNAGKEEIICYRTPTKTC